MKETIVSLLMVCRGFCAHYSGRFFISLGLSFFLGFVTQPSLAFQWKDLWATPQQQGHALMEKGDFVTAEERFKEIVWKGTAAYRAGNYRQAAGYYSSLKTVDGYYNQGNAWVQLGRYEDALKAYEAALTLDPMDEDAKYNRDKVRMFLKHNPQQSSKDQQSQKTQEKRRDKGNSSEEDQDQTDKNTDSGKGKDSKEEQENKSKQSEQQGSEQNNRSQDTQEKEGTESNRKETDNSKETNNQEGGKKQPENQTNGNQKEKNKDALREKSENPDPSIQTSKHQSKPNDNTAPKDNDAAVKDQQVKSEDKELSDKAVEQKSGTPSDQTVEAELNQRQEQWLRLIPDDPGGLLREKFFREHQRRAQQM